MTTLCLDSDSPSATPRNDLPRWQRIPTIPLALTAVLLLFVLFPPVADNPRLAWTFGGVGAGLLAWMGVLALGVKRWPHLFQVEFSRPRKSHYIQASVQLCIYAYWGWYWRDVYSVVPLIVAQLVFLYAFDALLTWSRGRRWLLGCGPLPIILSTNVFIWFREDWFAYQFLMVAVGSLGKEFIRWNRDGRRVHVFNPSAFTLAVFSIVLIATDGTNDYTWAGRIADTVAKPPHIYLVIFGLGLIVQYFFSVTLITFSAAATLCVLNLIYTASTGTYFFVFTNIPAPVFLGLHLLVTDPATSPRNNAGRVVFGVLYGALAFTFFGLLQTIERPTVYDKLLPVPLLNLCVPWIDRLTQVGFLGRFTRWEATIGQAKLNVVHMGCWSVLFLAMFQSGFVEKPHEGATYKFWKEQLDAGNPKAAHGLLEVLKAEAAEGSSAAWNELGVLTLEGKIVEKDAATAVRYFAKSSKLGNVAGSANLVAQYFATEGAFGGQTVSEAFDHLERSCAKGAEPAVYYLIGRAYETGRGRPRDPSHAQIYYKEGCARGSQQACAGLARVAPR